MVGVLQVLSKAREFAYKCSGSPQIQFLLGDTDECTRYRDGWRATNAVFPVFPFLMRFQNVKGRPRSLLQPIISGQKSVVNVGGQPREAFMVDRARR